MRKTTVISSIAALAIALAAGNAIAAKMKAVGPEPGDCKRAFEAATAGSEQAAKAAWTQKVAGKFGNNWAHWVGASGKVVTPLGGQQFQATAKPCFYYPVP